MESSLTTVLSNITSCPVPFFCSFLFLLQLEFLYRSSLEVAKWGMRLEDLPFFIEHVCFWLAWVTLLPPLHQILYFLMSRKLTSVFLHSALPVTDIIFLNKTFINFFSIDFLMHAQAAALGWHPQFSLCLPSEIKHCISSQLQYKAGSLLNSNFHALLGIFSLNVMSYLFLFES